jgi:hypothetical protein
LQIASVGGPKVQRKRKDLFNSAIPKVASLAHPSVYMLNRSDNLAGVFAACIAAGRHDLVKDLLPIEYLNSAFADVTGSQEGLALSLLLLTEGIIGEGDLTCTKEVTEAAQLVWNAIRDRGCVACPPQCPFSALFCNMIILGAAVNSYHMPAVSQAAFRVLYC